MEADTRRVLQFTTLEEIILINSMPNLQKEGGGTQENVGYTSHDFLLGFERKLLSFWRKGFRESNDKASQGSM